MLIFICSYSWVFVQIWQITIILSRFFKFLLLNNLYNWSFIFISHKLLFGFFHEHFLEGLARVNASKFGIISKHFIGQAVSHTLLCGHLIVRFYRAVPLRSALLLYHLLHLGSQTSLGYTCLSRFKGSLTNTLCIIIIMMFLLRSTIICILIIVISIIIGGIIPLLSYFSFPVLIFLNLLDSIFNNSQCLSHFKVVHEFLVIKFISKLQQIIYFLLLFLL